MSTPSLLPPCKWQEEQKHIGICKSIHFRSCNPDPMKIKSALGMLTCIGSDVDWWHQTKSHRDIMSLGFILLGTETLSQLLAVIKPSKTIVIIYFHHGHNLRSQMLTRYDNDTICRARTHVYSYVMAPSSNGCSHFDGSYFNLFAFWAPRDQAAYTRGVATLSLKSTDPWSIVA